MHDAQCGFERLGGSASRAAESRNGDLLRERSLHERMEHGR
jgi:hypothetical protein